MSLALCHCTCTPQTCPLLCPYDISYSANSRISVSRRSQDFQDKRKYFFVARLRARPFFFICKCTYVFFETKAAPRQHCQGQRWTVQVQLRTVPCFSYPESERPNEVKVYLLFSYCFRLIWPMQLAGHQWMYEYKFIDGAQQFLHKIMYVHSVRCPHTLKIQQH